MGDVNFSGSKVLLIDDQSVFLDAHRKLLMESFGIVNVETAQASQEIKETLTEGSFDLILCDGHLPKDFYDELGSGREVFDFTRALDNSNAKTPFILVSNNPVMVMQEKEKGEMDGVFEKSDKKGLKTAVGRVLRRRLG